MHELSLCRGLLKRAVAIAQQHQAQRIATVHVQIGPLSGVDGQLLRHAWPTARAGTMADRAELIVECTPVRAACLNCGNEFSCPANKLACPTCHSTQTRLLSGDEMVLADLELVLAKEH